MNERKVAIDEEEEAWKNREISLFEERLSRRRMIRKIEKNAGMERFYTGMPFNVPINARYVYWKARDSFIYGLFFASINTIASCIEATILGKIDPNYFKDLKPNKLVLFKLIEICYQNRLINFDLYYSLHEFRVYRNNVIHSKIMIGTDLYPSQITHYSGKSKSNRSVGCEQDKFLIKILKKAPSSTKIDKNNL